VYFPFGEEATSPVQDSERMKFTGHERDLASQAGANPAGDDLDYMHARHYSPLTGRFVTTDRRDVLGLQFGDADQRREFDGFLAAPQSWNRYCYALDSPLKLVDPDGEAAVAAVAAPALVGSGAAGGTAAGVVAALGPGALAVGVGAAGYGLGILVNRIPVGGGDTVGEEISNAMVGLFFSSRAGDARNLINTRVATVLEHISKYSPPDPNNPHNRSDRKNIWEKMRQRLESARDKLKRLPKRQQEHYEQLIRRAEEELERWWAGR
jgi:RHS repeat-associated protein